MSRISSDAVSAFMKRIRIDDLAEMMELGKLTCAEYCPYCRKIRYPSLAEARRAGAAIAAAGKGHTRPYPCPKRDGWHLTSKAKQTKKKPRRQKRDAQTEDESYRF